MAKMGKIALVLVVLFAVGLVGCGKKEATPPAMEAAPAAEAPAAEGEMLTCVVCGMQMAAADMKMIDGKAYCAHCAPAEAEGAPEGGAEEAPAAGEEQAGGEHSEGDGHGHSH